MTPWTAAQQFSLSITISWNLLKLISIESVMPSNYLVLCCPLLVLPSIFLRIRVFSNKSAVCIRWPKYWSFSFNISPSSEHPGLISFRMDWLDLLAVRDSQESSPTPQFKSISSSVLSFLHGPTLTSLHDYWKKQNFDYMDLCWQCLFFSTHCLGGRGFCSMEKASFNLLAALMVYSNFGAQENKVCHCCHCIWVIFAMELWGRMP